MKTRWSFKFKKHRFFIYPLKLWIGLSQSKEVNLGGGTWDLTQSAVFTLTHTEPKLSGIFFHKSVFLKLQGPTSFYRIPFLTKFNLGKRLKLPNTLSLWKSFLETSIRKYGCFRICTRMKRPMRHTAHHFREWDSR